MNPTEIVVLRLSAAKYVCNQGYGPNEAAEIVRLSKDEMIELRRWFYEGQSLNLAPINEVREGH